MFGAALLDRAYSLISWRRPEAGPVTLSDAHVMVVTPTSEWAVDEPDGVLVVTA